MAAQAGQDLAMKRNESNQRQRVPMKKTILILLLAGLGAGCTHSTRLTRTPVSDSAYQPLARPVRIGFTPTQGDPLLDAVIQEIATRPAVEEVRKNCQVGGVAGLDYVCDVSLEPQYKASGQNFFIAFPGFIVFTHALVGFKYTADFQTRCTLYDAGSNEVSQVMVEAPYEFRHCSFARGAAAGLSGWVVPGYGAAAIIPGAIFAGKYDKRATEDLLQKVSGSYSDLMSSRLMRQIQEAQSAMGARQGLPGGAGEPVPVTIGEVPGEQPGNGEYGVYVMRVNGLEVGEPEGGIRELPASPRATLDGMSRSGMVPEDGAMEDLLMSLGISPGDYFGNLDQVRIFTQVQETLVPLQSMALN
jgi:hypothetical protein